MSKDKAKEEEVYEVTEPRPENTVHKEKKVTIMFRENRKFDLHIGRDMITFRGRENKQVPASWLKHRDWTPAISKKFIVKGV